jgi:hypothetical protein
MDHYSNNAVTAAIFDQPRPKTLLGYSMSTIGVRKLMISTKANITAFDKDGKPVEQYTGQLAVLGPIIQRDFPEITIRLGKVYTF